MSGNGVRDAGSKVGSIRPELPSKLVSTTERAPARTLGAPKVPSSSFEVQGSLEKELKLIVDGGGKTIPTPPVVCRHIEALMEKRGFEAMKDLDPRWRAQVEKTVEALPAGLQGPTRFVLTQKILEIPGARAKDAIKT